MLKKYLTLIVAVILATINAQAAKLYITDFSIDPGQTKTIGIIMENSDIQVWQAQLDVRLPEGLSVVKDDGDLIIDLVRNSNRNKHTLEANETEGVVRILVSTTSDKTIEGTDGTFISLDIVAAANFTSGVITLENMKLVPLEGSSVIPANSECQVNGAPVPTSVTIKANNLSMTYGDAVPALTYTVTEGQALGTPALSCEATSQSPVGTYPIKISKGTLTNDVVNLTDGTLTINKAPLTITAKSYSIKRGESLPNFEVTYNGFKNNENESVLTVKPTIRCNATSDSQPGNYEIIVSGAEASNYDISYVAGTLTIENNAEVIIAEDGSMYIANDDYTASFLGNPNASGSFEIPASIKTSTGIILFITSIAEEAFMNNTALTEIIIPETVTAIGGYAFHGCINLISIISKPTTPPTIYDGAVPVMKRAKSAFAGVDKENCILYVPTSCIPAYAYASGWNEFEIILEIGSSAIRTLSADGESGDIYDMSGRLVRKDATSLEGLTKGVYIINGRKVVKK